MAPASTTLTTKVESGTPYQLESSQTLRATSALIKKIQSDDVSRKESTGKTDLLADAAESEDENDNDATPIWLVLTTKKHVVDKKRLKPGKIALPHPYHSASSPNLRICLITADPQRTYKDIVAHPSFPPTLAAKIGRVIGITKLKAKYKSYESRRQLLGEYDVFLADDRIITYLPQVLGKIFYGGGAKRPVPVTLEGKRETKDENGAKRLKLSEGGAKVTKAAPRPDVIAKEIEKAIGSALVHLSPSTNTAVRVGKSSWSPEQVAENVEAVVKGLTEKYVTKGWRNVRAIHVKGPNTASLPIWLAEELWEDEADVLDKAPEPKAIEGKKKDKKRKRSALTEAVPEAKEEAAVEKAEKPKKKRKSDGVEIEADEKAKRREILKRQKEEAKKAAA